MEATRVVKKTKGSCTSVLLTTYEAAPYMPFRISLSIMARSSAKDGSEDVTEYEKNAITLSERRRAEHYGTVALDASH